MNTTDDEKNSTECEHDDRGRPERDREQAAAAASETSARRPDATKVLVSDESVADANGAFPPLAE